MNSLVLFLIILSSPFHFFSLIEKDTLQTDKPQHEQLLYGKWYLKEVLVNGKPHPDFPVVNEALILNTDRSYEYFDKTYDLKEWGKWQLIDSTGFVMSLEGNNAYFNILKLTQSELKLGFGDNTIMVRTYRR